MTDRPPSWPSPIEADVLRLLLQHGESYGLELVRTSAGAVKRGTVYVTLGRMEDKGLVESCQESNPPDYIGIARRLYKATGLGEKVLRAYETSHAALTAVFT